MEKQEYLSSIEKNLEDIINDYRFNNYKKQVIAWNLSTEFRRKYDEDYLWNRALYLSTNACILLSENHNKRLALKSLKESAEIYEYFSKISEKYDKEYCLILSSFCYDLAGYQANSLCLIKHLEEYEFSTSDNSVNLSPDNYILYLIRQILLKNIPKARAEIKTDLAYDLGIKLFNTALHNWFENVLNGVENEFPTDVHNAYLYYLNSYNLPISHLLFLLRTRLTIYTERSVWQNLLRNDLTKSSTIWKKYVRLLTYDIYDRNKIKDINKRISRFELWVSQLRAIEKGLLDTDENFIIQMPTSSGKTFIAELTILKYLVKYPGKKCIYIAPFRALTNEKEAELADYLSKLGYSVSALSGSYEVDEFHHIILEDTDVLIATPEKIDLLLRLNPEYFDNTSLIVIDEGQIVGEISARSSLLEFLIIRLRIRVQSLKTLFISAVMPPANANEYSLWLSGRSDNVLRSLLHRDSPVDEEWEPTRKLLGYFVWDGVNGRINYRDVETEDEQTRVKLGAFIPSFIKKKQYVNKYPDGSNKAQTSASLAFEFSKNGNCLVFCAKVADTERVGKALLEIIGTIEESGQNIPEYFRKNPEKESFFYSSKWFGKDTPISNCLERGIGIHFGDMPESVRRSVESDYETGKLRVLIATNTVSQGINFPIKYVIVHSTIVTFYPKQRQFQTISVRDFWNIIGRAGRAGKETEGQMIFVVNSVTDFNTYHKLADKSNIENAYSMFFNVLDALMDHRISNDTYENYVRILSEPYLLNLLIEESTDDSLINLLDKIVNNSLFKVQAESRNISIQPLRNSFDLTLKTIRREVPEELVKVFSSTGLCLKSNQSMANYIDLNKEVLRQMINEDNYLALIGSILVLFDEANVDEINSDKLNKIGLKPSNYFNILKMWIGGEEIEKLHAEWAKIKDGVKDLNVLISDGFYYRYSWAISSFINILHSKLNLDIDKVPEGIRNLASYVKYGLNNPVACLARSLGVKNRDIALLLSQKSEGLHGREFIKWIANLTSDDIEEFPINQYDKANILSVAVKLSPTRYEIIPDTFEFYVRGTPYEENRKATSRTLIVGDKLIYIRDPSNEFDPYAISILSEENQLGYVPREFSKMISVEIDINYAKYEIEVLKKEPFEDYFRVIVSMSRTKPL